MNNECKIISDLLPLYAEDMVCEETAEFIKNHLAECENCKNDFKALEDGDDIKEVFVPKENVKEAYLAARGRNIRIAGMERLEDAPTAKTVIKTPASVIRIPSIFNFGLICRCTF